MHTRSKKGKSEREEKKKDGQTTNDVAGRFAIGIRSSIAQGVLYIQTGKQIYKDVMGK